MKRGRLVGCIGAAWLALAPVAPAVAEPPAPATAEAPLPVEIRQIRMRYYFEGTGRLSTVDVRERKQGLPETDDGTSWPADHSATLLVEIELHQPAAALSGKVALVTSIARDMQGVSGPTRRVVLELDDSTFRERRAFVPIIVRGVVCETITVNARVRVDGREGPPSTRTRAVMAGGCVE